MFDFEGRNSRLAALFLAAAIGGGLLSAAVQARKEEPVAEPRFQLNAKFREAVRAAQAALAVNDSAAVQAALASASSLAQTSDEQFVLAQLDMSYAQQSGDRARASLALDKLIANGMAANRLTQADKAAYFESQGEFAYQAKDYAKAERAFGAALAAGNSDPRTLLYLADSQANDGRPADAVQSLLKAIDAKTAAGQKAPADWYERGADIASRATLPDAFVRISAAWLAAYPDHANWYVALTIYRQIGGVTGEANLDLMRLMRVAASPTFYGHKDFVNQAQAVYLKFPNEAVSLLHEGVAAGKISLAGDPPARQIMTQAEPRIAAQRASLKTKATVAKSTSYAAALATGDLFAAYDDFAKAADWYKLALASPGADPGQANVRLGAALAQAGDKDGARAALGQVSSGPYAPIAAYWMVWIDHPPAS